MKSGVVLVSSIFAVILLVSCSVAVPNVNSQPVTKKTIVSISKNFIKEPKTSNDIHSLSILSLIHVIKMIIRGFLLLLYLIYCIINPFKWP